MNDVKLVISPMKWIFVNSWSVSNYENVIFRTNINQHAGFTISEKLMKTRSKENVVENTIQEKDGIVEAVNICRYLNLKSSNREANEGGKRKQCED